MASPRKKLLRYLEMEANISLETENSEIETERLREQNDVLEAILNRKEDKLISPKTKTKSNRKKQNNRNKNR
tara:strand:+ start:607 stop:822 length:216 start_codon:yes stop_codon:yes gene_type:complete